MPDPRIPQKGKRFDWWLVIETPEDFEAMCRFCVMIDERISLGMQNDLTTRKILNHVLESSHMNKYLATALDIAVIQGTEQNH